MSKLSKHNVIEIAKIPETGTGTFVKLPGVQDINIPSKEVEEIENTSQDSDNREFFAGFADLGEGTYEMNWDVNSGAHDLLEELEASREFIQIRFKLWKTAENTYAYTKTRIGFIKGYEINAPVGGKFTASVTFRFTGEVA